MHAIALLRSMHADARTQFKLILGTSPPTAAADAWAALQPVLDLHEEIEDRFVYGPVRDEAGPGTLLGDWAVQHDADVEMIKHHIEQVAQFGTGTPAWQMAIAASFELLSKHVLVEENEIFGRIEQLWGAKRLAQVGKEMEAMVTKAKRTQRPAQAARA